MDDVASYGTKQNKQTNVGVSRDTEREREEQTAYSLAILKIFLNKFQTTERREREREAQVTAHVNDPHSSANSR